MGQQPPQCKDGPIHRSTILGLHDHQQSAALETDSGDLEEEIRGWNIDIATKTFTVSPCQQELTKAKKILRIHDVYGVMWQDIASDNVQDSCQYVGVFQAYIRGAVPM